MHILTGFPSSNYKWVLYHFLDPVSVPVIQALLFLVTNPISIWTPNNKWWDQHGIMRVGDILAQCLLGGLVSAISAHTPAPSVAHRQAVPVDLLTASHAIQTLSIHRTSPTSLTYYQLPSIFVSASCFGTVLSRSFIPLPHKGFIWLDFVLVLEHGICV